jgi:hypothetical protein
MSTPIVFASLPDVDCPSGFDGAHGCTRMFKRFAAAVAAIAASKKNNGVLEGNL